MKALEWEQVGEGTEQRAKVFGGWVLKVMEDVHVSLHEDMRPQTDFEWRPAMVFIPDPKHEWGEPKKGLEESIGPASEYNAKE